eukprot:867148-Heterocapsa_arctica.AAC.1
MHARRRSRQADEVPRQLRGGQYVGRALRRQPYPQAVGSGQGPVALEVRHRRGDGVPPCFAAASPRPFSGPS